MTSTKFAGRGMFVPRALVTAVVATVVGCASNPQPPQLPALDVAPSERTWTAPALIANRLALGAAPAGEALTADDVLAAVITFNPRMKLARAQLELGSAGVQIARERTNPTLSLSPEHLIAAAAGVSPWVLAVSVVWPMRTAGKRELAIEQALESDNAAQLNAAAVVWALRVDARASTCAVEFAWARHQLAAEESAIRSDLVARLEKQAGAGMVSMYEVARARMDSAAGAQRLQQADADLLSARHDVSALAGLPMAELEKRQIASACLSAVDLPNSHIPSALREQALARRLDFRAKLAEFRAADATWRAEIARRYPDLALGPGYMYDQGDRKITFSLSFELPIHSHNAGTIAKARADRDRVAAEAEILQDGVAADVEKAYDLLTHSRAQLASTESILAQAQALLDRDLERERAGEIDRPTSLLSRIALLAARNDALTARKSVVDATATLEAALQMPISAPRFNVEAIDSLLKVP